MNNPISLDLDTSLTIIWQLKARKVKKLKEASFLPSQRKKIKRFIEVLEKDEEVLYGSDEKEKKKVLNRVKGYSQILREENRDFLRLAEKHSSSPSLLTYDVSSGSLRTIDWRKTKPQKSVLDVIYYISSPRLLQKVMRSRMSSITKKVPDNS